MCGALIGIGNALKFDLNDGNQLMKDSNQGRRSRREFQSISLLKQPKEKEAAGVNILPPHCSHHLSRNSFEDLAKGKGFSNN